MDSQRRQLAVKGKQLGGKLPAEVTSDLLSTLRHGTHDGARRTSRNDNQSQQAEDEADWHESYRLRGISARQAVLASTTTAWIAEVLWCWITDDVLQGYSAFERVGNV